MIYLNKKGVVTMKSFFLSTLALILYILFSAVSVAGLFYYVLPGLFGFIFLIPIPNSILMKARACANNIFLKFYNTLVPFVFVICTLVFLFGYGPSLLG